MKCKCTWNDFGKNQSYIYRNSFDRHNLTIILLLITTLQLAYAGDVICHTDYDQHDECQLNETLAEKLNVEIPYGSADQINTVKILTENSQQEFNQIPTEIFIIFPHTKRLENRKNVKTFSAIDFLNANELQYGCSTTKLTKLKTIRSSNSQT